jgi:hypothetical protein
MSVVSSLFRNHRADVVAADSADPTSVMGFGIQTEGWDTVLFALNFTATGSPSLTVVPLWFDEEAAVWLTDTAQQKSYTVAGKFLLPITSYGYPCFLKVTAIGGTNPSLSVRVGLERRTA